LSYAVSNNQCFLVVFRVTIKFKQRNLTENILKTRFLYNPMNLMTLDIFVVLIFDKHILIVLILVIKFL
jgi:hypothetical protein